MKTYAGSALRGHAHPALTAPKRAAMLASSGWAAGCWLAAFAAVPAAVHAAPAGLAASGCEEQELSVPYPSEPFRKMLPPGFTLSTLDPVGLLAAVDISIDRCDSVDGGAGSEDFLAFVEVTPPAEFQQPGLAAYGLLIKLWSTRPETVDAFAAWGFGEQAAAGEIEFNTGLDLLGRHLGSVKVQSGDSRLRATTAFAKYKSIYPSGSTRAFAQDAQGSLHVLDATWTDQTFQYGLGTLTQLGSGPLPLPLPVQVYPVLAAHATDYALTLQPIQ